MAMFDHAEINAKAAHKVLQRNLGRTWLSVLGKIGFRFSVPDRENLYSAFSDGGLICIFFLTTISYYL